MSQKKDILNYMQTRGPITNAIAAREFNCYRLSARILELKQDGVPIVCDMVDSRNDSGDFKRYGSYRIG